MKKIIIFLCCIFVHQIAKAQVDTDSIPVNAAYAFPINDSIYSAIGLTDEIDEQYIQYWTPSDSSTLNTENVLWYYIYSNGELPPIQFLSEDGFRELTVYGPFPNDYAEAAELILTGQAEPFYTNVTWVAPPVDSTSTEELEMESETELLSEEEHSMIEEEQDSVPVILVVGETSFHESLTLDGITEEGLYILRVGSYAKTTKIEIEPEEELAQFSNFRAVENKPRPCVECINGDMPEEGPYIVSAWVSMDDVEPGTTSYEGPRIIITTSGGPLPAIIPNEKRFIIDGWQLIEGEFEIPSGNSVFTIQLQCGTEAGSTCYFDDIRFQPLKASMKTYVYDPLNLRLVAELDERHYSTLYEYDEDGQLKRIKKETERGVMTIQESSSKTKNYE